MRRLALLLAPLVLLLATGCSGINAYDLPLPGKQVSSGDGYQVTADFADIVDVVPRTLVMANDVPIGQVDSIERVGWHARVTMTIRKDIVLPADATADVRQTSLLGEKYVALEAPSGSTVQTAGGRLEDGDAIPLARTGLAPGVEDVLGALSFLLSRGGVGQLKTISTELNTMMEGRESSIRDVLGRLDTLVGSLDRHKSQIVDAMAQVNALTRTLNQEKTAITGAIDSFGPALEVLHQQHRDLVTMLTSLDKLGTVATRVIDDSGANLTQVLADLKPTLTRLADAGDSLPRGLMMLASFPFPKQAETLAKGDYANALFHMDLDLGKVIDSLAKGKNPGIPELLQLCTTYSTDCDAIQPLAKSLCQLTGVEIACSVVGKPSVQTGKNPGGKKKQPSTTPSAPSTGGLLGGVLGGGSSGSSGSSGSGGLLGGLLGGGG